MNFENRTLKLKAKTWSRDSYGLFDFETKKFFSQNLDIKSPGQIIRDNNDIQFVPQSAISSFKSINTPNVEILAAIALENGSITLKPHTNQSDIDINQHLWQVIRHGDYDSTGYLLKCDDIIKVGRVIFKIKHIKLNEEKTGMQTTESQESILDSIKQHLDTLQPIERMPVQKDKPRSEDKGATTASLCRICLSEHNDEDDPFISPCSCTGSMLNVHLLCLQRWVKTKLDIQENKNIITVYWKNLDCELCKTPLPIILRQGGQEYNLIPVDIMNVGSYIVMESLSKDKKPIGIHIIDTTGTNKITLGRGHDSDLKINDISVSRVHATMKIDKGKIYIQDNKSKFGTVVLKKNDTVFDESLTDVTLQNKRTILKFSVKRPWLTYLPCIGTKLVNSSLSVLNFKNIRSKTIADDDYDLQDQQEQTKQMDLK